MNRQKEIDRISFDEARRLIQRFDNGETSVSEERRLCAFFANHRNLPSDLEENREMFAWFDKLDASSTKEPMPAGRESSRRPLNWWQWAAAAAIAALVATSSITTAASMSELNELRETYEGSFIVVDGRKESDIRKILPAIKYAEIQSIEFDHQVEQEINEFLSQEF